MKCVVLEYPNIRSDFVSTNDLIKLGAGKNILKILVNEFGDKLLSGIVQLQTIYDFLIDNGFYKESDWFMYQVFDKPCLKKENYALASDVAEIISDNPSALVILHLQRRVYILCEMDSDKTSEHYSVQFVPISGHKIVTGIEFSNIDEAILTHVNIKNNSFMDASVYLFKSLTEFCRWYTGAERS